MKRSIFVFLSLLVAVSFVLTACQTPTEAPTVEETEVVATEEPTETEPTEMVYEPEPFGENLPTAQPSTHLWLLHIRTSPRSSAPSSADTGYDRMLLA